MNRSSPVQITSLISHTQDTIPSQFQVYSSNQFQTLHLKMQHIPPTTLSSLPERISYLKAFLNFTPTDVHYLHAAAPIIKPLIPTVVDTVYVKLLSFDITAKAFVPRQSGFEGKSLEERGGGVAELTAEDEQIKFRKGFLTRYLARLVEMGYEDEGDWEYLDKVAVMHTGQSGFQHR